MKRRYFNLFFCAALFLNCFLPAAKVIAVEKDSGAVDPQVQMSLDGKKEASVTKSLKSLSLAVSYKQVQLDERTNQTDHLVIELPSGVTYSDGETGSVSFDKVSREIVIDLAKVPVQSIELELDYDQMADQTVLQGTHYLNNQAVGTSEELTLTKEPNKGTLEKNTAESQAMIPIEEDNDRSKATEFGTTPMPRANLDLGMATSRQLPVQTVTDGQFGNVSYFDVGTYDEWDAALTATNNNKQEITYINLTASFALDTGTHFENVDTSSRSYTTTKTGKKLVVNGNGQTIDNRGRRLEFDGRPWDVVFQNLKLQSANAWGAVDGYNSAPRGIYTFHDVHQTGHQLYEGSKGRVILSGVTSAVMASDMRYSSNIDGQDIYINTGYGAGSGNINAGEIYIKADAQVLLKNGHLGADIVAFKDGNIYFEEGGQTSLTLDNTEKNIKWNKWGGLRDYAVSALTVIDRPVSSEHWNAAEIPSGSSLAGLKNSIHLADNTQLIIRNGEQRKEYSGAVQILDSGGKFRVGKNATVDILVEEDSSNDSSSNWSTRGNSQIPIFLKNGTRFEVAENAKFKLDVGKSIATGHPVSSLGPVIKSDSQLDLSIDENAQFEVKAASDSSLIQDNSNGGSLTVADQATLDLGFTEAASKGLIDLQAGSVSIPTSGEYIHRIRQWNNGNYDEAAPTEEYHPIDGTKISYSGTNITNRTTNLAAGFADSSPSVKEKFENNFTSSAQRIVVDPVVFNVKTINELTNETKAEYSVKGTAEPPGEKIELSGGPLAGLSVAEKQVLVQTDGSYEWKGTLSRPFYWGETIRASYVGHSDKYAETFVEDVTKPTGAGRTIHLVEGETIPIDKAFIASVEDTNALETSKNAFDYSFLGSAINSGGAATITNSQESQEFVDQVIIDDTRGNHSDPVEVRLIVHKANTINSMMAQDLTVRWSDVSGFTVGSTDYQTYLKNGMKAKAQTIIAGNLIDLSSSIQIENSSSIPNTVGGPYVVRFVVIADAANQLGADLVNEVQLTVLPNLTDPRDPSVPDPTENENEGTGEHGELRLDYVPSRFDLGSKEIQWKDMEYQAIGTSDQWIQIADERPAATGWTLKAAATPFDSGTDQLTGASLIIPKGDMYNKKTAGAANSSGLVSKGDVPLTTTASALFTGDGVNSKNESTYVWKKNQVKLKVPKGQGKVGQTYRSTITWTVEAGATN